MLAVDKALQSPLLSPPTSPRMSTYATEPASSGWPSRQAQGQNPSAYAPYPSAMDDSRYQPSSILSSRPPLLRSHKSVPSFLEPTQSLTRSHSVLGTVSENATVQDIKDRPLSSPMGTSTSEPALSIETSTVATSPAGQLTTPTSPNNNNDSSLEDDAMLDIDGDDEIDDDRKSGSEKRADKRKMKRFRLTHNQTRYLMSEFARQAHPDAAHRERLSREIPGLSPRQVQVWFQNRRAKMKRLTADDQERMLKSRALPEDFDMAHALHSPYVTQSMMGTPLASPVPYGHPYSDAPYVRPLIIENIRRQSDDESTTSPLSLQSAYGSNFYTPPGSDNVSPISTNSDRHFGTLSSNQASPRSANPFVRSSSFSAGGYQHHQIPRLQLQDRVGRSRAESLQSPLRSSITYSSNSLDYGEDRRPAAEQPLSARGENPAAPYGIGHQNVQMHGFQNAAMSRVRPMNSSIPPSLQLKSEYRPPSSAATPQMPSFPMQSAPLAPPPEYHFPQLSAPYHSTSFNGSYGQQSSGVSALSVPSSAHPYSGPAEPNQAQRPTHDNPSHHNANPSANVHSQSYEIPRRSFTYDYGSQQH